MKKYLFILIALLVGCGDGWEDLTYQERYDQAVADAMVRQQCEISNELTVIDSSPALVVTFTSYPDSYPVGEEVTTWWGETWVTVATQLKDKIVDEGISTDNYKQRIIEILGLSPDSEQEYIIEFYVDANNLFRPTPDSEINDNTSQLTFPDSATTEYQSWFNNKEESVFGGDTKYPWTGLGYSYDWGKEDSDFGLSEFVVNENSTITIYSNTHYSEYFN